MDVTELRQEELDELKDNLFYQFLEWGHDELGEIHCPADISNEFVTKYYEGISFVEE